ncbi:hypothetical protein D9M68_553180 [compost metagenome]
MTTPAPAIDQLKELPLPPFPTGYVPQTWGWLVLLLVLLAAAAIWGWRRWRRWREDRYRREALARLAELDRALADQVQCLPALRELPELLKRVALSMPGEPAVAGLDGARWQAFLAAHAPTPLPDDFAARLATIAYASDAQVRAMPEAEVRALLGACRQWIEGHHVAV